MLTFWGRIHIFNGITGKVVEMAHHHADSLCCGGGGGRIFWDPEEVNRISETRIGEARDAGAEVIVTACPWCRIELEDAVKTLDVQGEMTVKDLAVMVAERV